MSGMDVDTESQVAASCNDALTESESTVAEPAVTKALAPSTNMVATSNDYAHTGGQLSTMTFEEIRANTARRYEQIDSQFALQLAQAQNSDQVWSLLNNRQTRHMQPEEFNKVPDIEALQESGMLDRFKAEAHEKYSVVDPQTGEKRLIDLNKDGDLDLLSDKLNLFIKKEHTKEQKERMEHAAVYDLPNAQEEDDGSANTMRKLTEQEAEHYKKTGELPEDVKKWHENFQERQVAMVQASLNEFNAIVAAPANAAHFVQCRVASMPFREAASRFFPLKMGVISEALTNYAKETRSALCMSNMLPTIIFESKLRLLIFGQKSFRVTPSFQYHAWMHAMWMWALSTDVRPLHAQFLAEEEEILRKYQESAAEERQQYMTRLREHECGTKLWFASQEDSVAEDQRTLKVMADVAFFARSLALAKKAWNNEQRVVSPYAEYLTRKEKPWRKLDIPRHSKEEIVELVQQFGEQERFRFSNELAVLEQKYKQALADGTKEEFPGQFAKMFLEELYLMNHVSTVQQVKIYETGLLLLFEKAIPPQWRADFTMRVDQVTNPDFIPKPVMDEHQQTKRFYRKLRAHCMDMAAAQLAKEGKASCITRNGVDLDVSNVPLSDQVHTNNACGMTYGEVYEFYVQVTTDYLHRDNMMKRVDAMDAALAAVYNQENGRLIENYDRIMDELLLRVETTESDAQMMNGAQKKRRK